MGMFQQLACGSRADVGVPVESVASATLCPPATLLEMGMLRQLRGLLRLALGQQARCPPTSTGLLRLVLNAANHAEPGTQNVQTAGLVEHLISTFYSPLGWHNRAWPASIASPLRRRW
jgi:hypothetical protein